MKKLNQKEYKVLRNYYLRGIRWISRNKNGNLVVSKIKQDKFEKKWLPQCPDEDWSELRNSQIYLFQFIQWKDDSPYNIRELIDEYEEYLRTSVAPKFSINGVEHLFENESEGKEMTKDIKWLKDEVYKLFPSHDEMCNYPDDITVLRTQMLHSVIDLIDQLDEPETVEQTTRLLENVLKENKRLGKLHEEKHEEWLELMDEINNQQKLSKDWIDEHSNGSSRNQYVWVDDLKEILVPKQEDMFNGETLDEGEVYFAIGLGGAVEINVARSIGEAIEILTEHETNYSVSRKPVIPWFVANVIEAYKSNSRLTNLLADLMFHGRLAEFVEHEDEDEMFEWARSNYRKATDEILARAWDGYEVAEEPLYRARLKVITDEFIASYLRTQSSDAEDRLKALEIGRKYIHEDYRHLSEFTKDELKRLDIWDSEQWEIEELEE